MPLVLFADQEALAGSLLPEEHRAGRRTVDAHLVLDAGALNVVRLAQAAIRIDPILGHDEQGQALGSWRRSGKPRQHRVDYVVRQIVIAVGDEDLLAGDEVAAVLLGLCLARRGPDIGARLRLGEAHRPGPLTREELLAEELAHLVGAELLDQLTGAARQHQNQRQGEVGTGKELVDRRTDDDRHAQATELRTAHAADPASFRHRLVGRLERLGDLDDSVLENRSPRDPRPRWSARSPPARS